MAGFYPDVPTYKMALDKDGAQWFYGLVTGTVVSMTSTQIANMTGAQVLAPASAWQVGPPGDPGLNWVAVVFPEKRDIAAVFGAATMLNGAGFNPTVNWETSLDTTNGLDGTWTQLVAPYTPPPYVVPNYRSGIISAAASAVKGIRIHQTGGGWCANFSAVHVYGHVTTGQNPDRMAFWHPTLDQELAPAAFDWGDVQRNSTQTRTFRIKNLSSVKTAVTPRVALSAIVDGSPSNTSQHTLSSDGSTWLSQLNFSDMAPGAVSGVLSLKRTMLTTAQPGLWLMRVFTEATSWS